MTNQKMEPKKVKTDPLVSFLYILARDHLPLGEVERIMKEHVEKVEVGETTFSNNFLAEYALALADRMRTKV